jgi:hypothetical protein
MNGKGIFLALLALWALQSHASDERLLTVGYLDNLKTMCSGTLISPLVVLTAAHCVYGRKPAELRFTLTHDVRHAPVAFVKAIEVRVHPAYRPSNPGNAAVADLALVKLASTDYGGTPKTFFAMSDPASYEAGMAVSAVGYGFNPDGSGGYRRSRGMKFQNAVSGVSISGKVIPDAVLQFTRGEFGDITCAGDSGGALLGNVAGEFNLVGVIGQGTVEKNKLTKLADGNLDTSPVAVCRAKFLSHATSLGEFREWLKTNNAELTKPVPASSPLAPMRAASSILPN